MLCFRVTNSFVNDALGCNSVTWAPYTAVGNLPNGNDKPSLRLATGSCDNTVRVWRFEGDWDNGHAGQWVEEKKVGSPHENWVRGVAWAPNTAMPYNILGKINRLILFYLSSSLLVMLASFVFFCYSKLL